MLPRRAYGNSGLRVSVLGLGAGQLGDPRQDDGEVARLLHAALDLGISLIDTARSYGLSEERIGRHLASRRAEFVLSTKLGYGMPGCPDWTGAAVIAGVDAALRRLATDHIDIVHLHSCDLATLQRGEVIDALDRAKADGKLACVAYSGENEALDWAVASGRFGGVQCSVNLFDQGSLATALPRALGRGCGVLAKRPLGNAPWRFAAAPPTCEEAGVYWQRMHQLAYPRHDLPWDELALRFAVYQPSVSSAIVGTQSIEHLHRSAAIVQQGPLSSDVLQAVSSRFRVVGGDWRGEV